LKKSGGRILGYKMKAMASPSKIEISPSKKRKVGENLQVRNRAYSKNPHFPHFPHFSGVYVYIYLEKKF